MMIRQFNLKWRDRGDHHHRRRGMSPRCSPSSARAGDFFPGLPGVLTSILITVCSRLIPVPDDRSPDLIPRRRPVLADRVWRYATDGAAPEAWLSLYSGMGFPPGIAFEVRYGS